MAHVVDFSHYSHDTCMLHELWIRGQLQILSMKTYQYDKVLVNPTVLVKKQFHNMKS